MDQPAHEIVRLEAMINAVAAHEQDEERKAAAKRRLQQGKKNHTPITPSPDQVS